jgi:hypothetical protein
MNRNCYHSRVLGILDARVASQRPRQPRSQRNPAPGLLSGVPRNATHASRNRT